MSRGHLFPYFYKWATDVKRSRIASDFLDFMLSGPKVLRKKPKTSVEPMAMTVCNSKQNNIPSFKDYANVDDHTLIAEKLNYDDIVSS